MRYRRINALSLAQQAKRLRQVQPKSKVRFDQRGNRLVWVGHLQPTVLSDKYRIRIEVKRSNQLKPDVFVEQPSLKDRDGATIPHLYDRDSSRLCLWLPGHGEWTSAMWIADSVLLWAAEWLFFYEIWYATGEWLGGGEHPER